MKQAIKKCLNTTSVSSTFIKTLVVSSFFLVNSVFAQEQIDNVETSDEADELAELAQTPLPIEQVNTFTEVFLRIKNSYVEPVTDEQLLDYAIEGMLRGLDPHSAYLKQEKYDSFNDKATGKFGGLGMEVVFEDGFVKVVAPIDDTPAAEAGIQSGDIIIEINGETVAGSDLRKSVDKMRGEPGTLVTLKVVRESIPEPFDVELRRAIINVKSVKRRRLSDKIGYLRISQFQGKTSESFRKELKKLNDIDDFSGLILDLRNNPGGLLTSAISISDAFLTDGIIVSTKGRVDESGAEYSATGVDLIDGKPIVVLINEGSASASEIVAGALQDHKRALILGTESFGKGSVQTVINVTGGAGLKLTTSRYYTPNGASIQASGITPDVLVKQRKFEEVKKGFERVKENDLPGHLENDSKPKVKKTSDETVKLLANDYQLNEAFNLLNGIILFK